MDAVNTCQRRTIWKYQVDQHLIGCFAKRRGRNESTARVAYLGRSGDGGLLGLGTSEHWPKEACGHGYSYQPQESNKPHPSERTLATRH
jgi:hypothetical protein